MRAATLRVAAAKVEPFFFRFDTVEHEYYDAAGQLRPHITGMLERSGWIDSRWYTEESSERGRDVHKLTADFDLGGLNVATCKSARRGWLLAYVEVAKRIKAEWSDVEVPRMHPAELWGGRPDRVGKAFRLQTVLEVKSGAKEKAHRIQTALQAKLVAGSGGILPARMWQRLALYIDEAGGYRLWDHAEPDNGMTLKKDFDEADRIVRIYGEAA